MKSFTPPTHETGNRHSHSYMPKTGNLPLFNWIPQWPTLEEGEGTRGNSPLKHGLTVCHHVVMTTAHEIVNMTNRPGRGGGSLVQPTTVMITWMLTLPFRTLSGGRYKNLLALCRHSSPRDVASVVVSWVALSDCLLRG